MDKVDFSLASLLNPSLHAGENKQGPKKTGASQKKKFTHILEESREEQLFELGPIKEFSASDEALTALMDAVHSTGSELADRPFHDEILAYKKAVRNFINYVLKNAFEIEKSQVRRKGKIKTHVQIQVIDHKLEELAAAILSGQTSQLERVSKIDEIKGLLVDLTITGVIKERDD